MPKALVLYMWHHCRLVDNSIISYSLSTFNALLFNFFHIRPLLCADNVFGSASAFFTSSKLVVFDCVAYGTYECIAITNVWLEQKVHDTWVYVKALTPPSYVAQNTMAYGAEVDYSASITGKGTFRVGFTVDADGYAISRYSNTRTF